MKSTFLLLLFTLVYICDSLQYSKSVSTHIAKLSIGRIPVQRAIPDDFIDVDAEIVKAEPKEAAQTKSLIPSIFGGIANKLTSGISRFQEQKAKNAKKAQQKREINSLIDKAFEGSGLMGGLVGNIVKGIGGIVAESLSETADDYGMVQVQIQNQLRNSPKASAALGEIIALGFPISSQSSSTNINGQVTKNFFYIIPAAGDRGEGQVTAQGSIDGGQRIFWRSLQLRTKDGPIDISRSDSGGGGGMSGSGGTTRGGGTVIDVEAF